MAKKPTKRHQGISGRWPGLSTFSSAAEERRTLALLYSEAGQDPAFQVDNDAVERDFAVLDREADALIRLTR